jgi:pyroglutamyl-peptidase
MIVVTGFDRFGSVKVNPSQLVVEALTRKYTNDNFLTAVLPTEFETAEFKVRQMIRNYRPDVCLCLGVAPGAGNILLERTAWNLDQGSDPDNTGATKNGLIVGNGPRCYHTRVNLEKLAAAMIVQDFPVDVSDDAGSYVCNHVYYSALHEIERLGLSTQCAFLHLPLTGEQTKTKDKGQSAALSFGTMLAAVEFTLETLVNVSSRWPFQRNADNSAPPHRMTEFLDHQRLAHNGAPTRRRGAPHS